MGRATSSGRKSAAKVDSDAQSSETKSAKAKSAPRNPSDTSKSGDDKSKSGMSRDKSSSSKSRSPAKKRRRQIVGSRGCRCRRSGKDRTAAAWRCRARRNNVAGRDRESAQALPAEAVLDAARGFWGNSGASDRVVRLDRTSVVDRLLRRGAIRHQPLESQHLRCHREA